MSGIEKRGWEDELNAAWAEVNKARRELAAAVDRVAASSERRTHGRATSSARTTCAPSRRTTTVPIHACRRHAGERTP
jgi:hypothetical protein